MKNKKLTMTYALMLAMALTACGGAKEGAAAGAGSAGAESAAIEVTVSADGAIVAGETPSGAGGATSPSERGRQDSGASNAVAEETQELPAPDFTLVDQYGETHTLSDYKGQAVFLNFWATWCPPCRAEMPDIQALYEELQGEESPEVVVLGVAGPHIYGNEGSAEDIASFLTENGYTYPTVMDANGSLMRAYGITAFPTTFMIDKEGQVAGYVTGMIPRDIMDDIIAQTLER